MTRIEIHRFLSHAVFGPGGQVTRSIHNCRSTQGFSAFGEGISCETTCPLNNYKVKLTSTEEHPKNGAMVCTGEDYCYSREEVE